MINIKFCKKCKEAFDIATNYEICFKCRNLIDKYKKNELLNNINQIEWK